MNKRKLHHYWRIVREIKTWQLALLLILFLAASTWALRQNSLGLEPRLQRVIVADERGEGVDQALRDIGNYITNHMNTHMDKPIELAETYNRDVQQVVEQAQESVNGEVYRQAQRVCEDPSVVLSIRAACIQDYVLENAPPGQAGNEVEFPDKAIYTYEFASPTWSPDLAGWLVLGTGLIGLTLISRALAGYFVGKTLKEHQ